MPVLPDRLLPWEACVSVFLHGSKCDAEFHIG